MKKSLSCQLCGFKIKKQNLVKNGPLIYIKGEDGSLELAGITLKE